MDKDDRSMQITADSDIRRGVFADLVFAQTSNQVTRLDFIQIEGEVDNSTLQGVLASRVYMTNESLIALRDMLIRHTKDWKAEPYDKAN
jgi:hypothetical protein